jgi:fibronectin-binding autotransporter adhesin
MNPNPCTTATSGTLCQSGSAKFSQTKSNRRMFGFGARIFAAAACSALALSQSAQAVNRTWSATAADGNFSNTANWVGATAPGVLNPSSNNVSTTDFMILNNASAITTILPDTSGTREIAGIIYDTGATSYTIGTLGGTALTVYSNASNNITMNAGVTTAQLINAQISVRVASSTNSSYTITNNATSSAATLTLAGGYVIANTTRGQTLNLTGSNTGNNTISGSIVLTQTGGISGALNKSGVGTWILSGSNSFVAATGVTINGGTLVASNAAALGTNATANTQVATINSTGTLQLSGGIILDNGLSLNLNTGGTISSNGSNTTNGRINVGTAAATSVTLSTVGSSDVFTIGNGSNDLTGGLADSVIHVAGPGTVFQNVASNYGGTWSVDSGTLRLGSATALGTASTAGVAFGASSTGKLQLNGNSATVVSLNTNATVGTPVVENGAAGTATLTVGGASGTSTYAGVLQNGSSGTLALTKSGASTLTLSGNSNTYSGATTISAGTFNVTNTSGSATGTSAVALNGGTLTGSGTISGTVTTASTGIITPGTVTAGSAGSGVLTLGNLTLVAGTTINYGLVSGNATANYISTGTLTLPGSGVVLNLYTPGTNTAFAAAGTYDLFQYTGLSGSVASAFTVGTSISGFTASFGTSGGFVQLTLTASGVIGNWTNGAATGNWNNVGNWTGGIPSLAGSSATFASGASGGTVNLDANKTVGGITFNNASSYTISSNNGSTLTLDNSGAGASISVLAGSHSINNTVAVNDNVTVSAASGTQLTIASNISQVSGTRSLTLSGGGTLVLSGSNSYSGATSVSNGTLNFNGLNALGTSGTLNLGGPTTNGTLQYATGNTADISGLVVNLNAGGGTIDTNGNNVNYANALGNSTAGGLTKVGSGTLTMAGNNTYTGATTVNGGTLTLTGSNATSGAFMNTGGTLNFSALNNFGPAGNLTFNGGTLQWATGTTTDISGATTITSNAGGGTLDTNGNNVLFASSLILSGTGNITKAGAGTLTLAAASSYTGSTILAGGVLSVGNGGTAATLGSGSLIFQGGTLTNSYNVGNTAGFGGQAIVVASGQTGTINMGNRMSLGGGGVTGSGTLNINLNTTVTRDDFNGSWTGFTGQLNIAGTGTGRLLNNGGTFNTNSFGNASVDLGGTAVLQEVTNTGGNTYLFGALSGSSATAGFSGATTGTATISVGALNTNTTFAGFLQSASALTKTGTGTLILTGTSNTYTGATTVNGGTLQVGDGGANGSIGANTVNVNAANLAFNRSDTFTVSNFITGTGGTLTQAGTGTLVLNGTGNAYSGVTTIQNGGTININSEWQLGGSVYGGLTFGTGGGKLQYASTLLNATTDLTTNGTSNQNVTLTGNATIDTNSNNVTFAQTFGNSGAGNFTKAGAGTLTLSGSSTYTGSTTISGGTLVINSTNSTSSVNISGGGATLQGGGTLTGTVITASGSHIAPGASGVGTLTVGGLQMVTGSIYDFEFNGTPANDKIIVSGSSLLTINGGAFNLYDEGTLTALTSLGTYTLIQYAGTIQGAGLDSSWTTASTTNTHIHNAATGYKYAFVDTGTSIEVVLTAASTIGTWNVDADGNWSNAGNWSGPGTLPPSVAGDSAILGAGSGLRTVTLNVNETVGGLTFNNPNSFQVNGANTLTMDNAGSGATVVVTGGTANGISAAMALNDNTTVTVSSGKSLAISGNISNTAGAKTLTVNGTGTLILSGSNTYGPSAGTVGTILSGGGTLQVGTSTALGAGDLSVAGNATLQSGAAVLNLANNVAIGSGVNATVDSQGNTLTLSGTISDIGGTGALTKIGSGALVLSGSNSYGGGTTLTNGILNVNSASSLGASTGNLTFNGGTLQLGATIASSSRNYVINSGKTATIDTNGSNLTHSGTISSVGSTNTSTTDGLVKNGAGTLTLGGANTYTGQTSIGAGTLNIANTLALQNSTLNYTAGTLAFDSTVTAATLGGLTGSQALTLTNGASAAVTLSIGNNNLNTSYSGSIGGLGGITKVGTGTLTLTGSSNYAGATTTLGSSTSVLEIAAGAVISGTTAGINGGHLLIDGGTLTASASSNITSGSSQLLVTSGTANFNGGLTTDPGANNGNLISVTGGQLNAASLFLGRTAANFGSQPGAGLTTAGLYVNGGAVHITGALNMGTNSLSNSSVNARMDSGSITVDGTTTITQNNNRWSALDINGGTFTSNDTTGAGVRIGGVRAGTANVNKITFGDAGQTGGNDVLSVTGGTLYVGSGGLVKGGTGAYTSTISLGAGAVGALADWSSSMAMSLAGGTTIQAADASATAHNIALSGQVSGAGGLTKTGSGTLSLTGVNSYSGDTIVNAGTLLANGYGAAQAATTANATNGSNQIEYVTLPTGIAVGQTISGLFGGGASYGSTTITAIDTGTNTITTAATFQDVTGSSTFDLSAWQSLGGGNVTVGTGAGSPVLDIGASTQAVSAVTLNSGTIQGAGGTLQGTSYAVNAGTVSTTLAGAGVNLTKDTAGTVVLSGSNSYTGTTSVISGNLQVTGSLASGSAVTVGNTTTGSLAPTLSGTGTVNGSVLIQGTADVGSGSVGHLAPGTGGATGTLTVGSLTLNAGSQLDWNLTNPSTLTHVTVTTAGGLTINGGQLNINGGTGTFAAAGVYNLIGYSGSLTGAATNLSLNATNQASGYTYTFGTAGGFITLTVAAPSTPPGTWVSSAGGNWSTASNWSGSTVPNAAGSTATFATAPGLTASGTVSLDSSRTVGHMVFNSAVASYTLGAGGGTLTIDNTSGSGSPDITVSAGSHTIAAPVAVAAGGVTVSTASGSALAVSGVISNSTSAAALTKTGTGTLTLTGSNSYSGGTTIQAGVLAVNGDAALGNTSGSVTYSTDGTNLGTLRAVGTVTSARNFILNNTGTIDTNGNSVTLNSGGVVSGVAALVKTGAGTLTLNGSNTYGSGVVVGTYVNQGTLRISSDSNLGNFTTPTTSGQVTLSNGATLSATSILSSNRQINLAAVVGTAPKDGGTAVSGIIDVASGQTATWTGRIFGLDPTSSLEVTGAGTLFLNNLNTLGQGGTNAFSGGIYIHGGNVQTGNGPQFADSILVADNGGRLVSNQTGVFNAPVYIGTGGAVRETASGFDVYRNGPIANVTGQTGGLTYQGSALNGSNSGKQGLGGVNTFTGNVTVNSGFTLSISQNANLGNTANQLNLNSATLAIEDGASNPGTGSSTNVKATFATSRQINLTGSSTINVSNTFDSVAYSGGLPGTNSLTPGANTFTVNGAITGGNSASLTKTGNGTLTLNGSQSYGTLTTTAGITNLNAVLGSGSSTIAATGGTTNISAGGNAGVQKLAALSVGSGAVATLTAYTGSPGPANVKTIDTSSLAIAGTYAAPTGKIDLTNNAMVVRAASGLTEANAIKLVASGENLSTEYWDGNGITSSKAANDNSGATAVGVIDNSQVGYTSFGGVTLDGSSADILFKYTYYGDADLNGRVNFDDYVQFLYGYNGGPATWLNGDFDMNGVVNFDDYLQFLAGYNATNGGTTNPLTSSNSIQAVPEPATNALLIIGAAALLVFQKKRRRENKAAQA